MEDEDIGPTLWNLDVNFYKSIKKLPSVSMDPFDLSKILDKTLPSKPHSGVDEIV